MTSYTKVTNVSSSYTKQGDTTTDYTKEDFEIFLADEALEDFIVAENEDYLMIKDQTPTYTKQSNISSSYTEQNIDYNFVTQGGGYFVTQGGDQIVVNTEGVYTKVADV